MFVTFWNPKYEKGTTTFPENELKVGKITVNLHNIEEVDWTTEKTDGYITVYMTSGLVLRVFGQQNFDRFDGLVREYAPHVSVSGTVHER